MTWLRDSDGKWLAISGPKRHREYPFDPAKLYMLGDDVLMVVNEFLVGWERTTSAKCWKGSTIPWYRIAYPAQRHFLVERLDARLWNRRFPRSKEVLIRNMPEGIGITAELGRHPAADLIAKKIEMTRVAMYRHAIRWPLSLHIQRSRFVLDHPMLADDLLRADLSDHEGYLRWKNVLISEVDLEELKWPMSLWIRTNKWWDTSFYEEQY